MTAPACCCCLLTELDDGFFFGLSPGDAPDDDSFLGEVLDDCFSPRASLVDAADARDGVTEAVAAPLDDAPTRDSVSGQNPEPLPLLPSSRRSSSSAEEFANEAGGGPPILAGDGLEEAVRRLPLGRLMDGFFLRKPMVEGRGAVDGCAGERERDQRDLCWVDWDNDECMFLLR